MSLAATLEAGSRDFLQATAHISPTQATAKPNPNQWSILECIEHVIIVEERYLSFLAQATPITPQPDSRKELRLFTTIRSRLTPIESPATLRPQGRFHKLSDAIAAFQNIRAQSIQFAQQPTAVLYALGAKHPRFGPLNAVEFLQLIDGHARRHADQIREILTTQPMKIAPKPTRPKKPTDFKRDPPDLPSDFTPNPDPDDRFDDTHFVTITESQLENLNLSNRKIDTFQLEGSVLNRIQFSESQFGNAIWKDVRLVNCDLANIQAHRLSFLRVELVDCRLTGFRASALEWQDVLIQNCDTRYALLQHGKFRHCEFTGCDMQDADLQEADLTASLLRSCNLTRADLRKAKLRGTDLRNSQIENMLVEINDLPGVIVDPAQAMVLARLLGLQIK